MTKKETPPTRPTSRGGATAGAWNDIDEILSAIHSRTGDPRRPLAKILEVALRHFAARRAAVWVLEDRRAGTPKDPSYDGFGLCHDGGARIGEVSADLEKILLEVAAGQQTVTERRDPATIVCVPLRLVLREAAAAERELRRMAGARLARGIGSLLLEAEEAVPVEAMQALGVAATNAIISCRLYRRAVTDPLTGVLSRSAFSRYLEEEVRFASEEKTPLSLIMIDIDGLDRVNSAGGLEAGEETLRRTARLIRTSVRETDLVARFGGDEFTVLLPDTDARGAERVAVKIGEALASTPLSDRREVRLSAGVAELADGDRPSRLLRRADQALCVAKETPGEGLLSLACWTSAVSTEKRADKLTGLFTGDPAADYRHLYLVQRTHEVLRTSRGRDELVRRSLDHFLEIAGARRGLVALETGGEPLQYRAARSAEGEDLERVIAFSEKRAAQAIAAGDWLRVETGLYLPLVVKGEGTLEGVLFLDFTETSLPGDRFTRFLAALCRQFSLAVENVGLVEEVETLNRELRARIEMTERRPDRVAGEKKSKRSQLKNEYEEIIGESPALIEVLEMLDKVVSSEVTVLILGESGTGKELIATAIHKLGPRRDRPYVSENCAAVTETLLESELFGYVKGAFTGAHRNKKGLFEVADKGTLFLDEVGDMSLGMQKKLLRALQEGEIHPVGSKGIKKVDVRVISATNRELKRMVREGTFREDLYYRLNVLSIHLPPLRERKSDIPLLLDFLMNKLAVELGVEPRKLHDETLEALVNHRWPGNIREMENEVKRMLALGDDVIHPDFLSPAILESAAAAR